MTDPREKTLLYAGCEPWEPLSINTLSAKFSNLSARPAEEMGTGCAARASPGEGHKPGELVNTDRMQPARGDTQIPEVKTTGRFSAEPSSMGHANFTMYPCGPGRIL